MTMGKQSPVTACSSAADCPFHSFLDFAASWQNPVVSVGCLVTVNAIYWVVMPFTSTITLAAVVGSLFLLVDLAAYLGKLPTSPSAVKEKQEQCCCCFDKVWRSPCLEGYFPSLRSRARLVIGLASAVGLFLTSVIGVQLSTLVYIGASMKFLSKPLRLTERSEFPIVARVFDSILALRPDASSICSSQPSSPSPDPVLNKNTSASPKRSSLVFKVDPMEMELTSPEKTDSPQPEQDELAPYMPSQSAMDEDLLSNPESTDDISASLMPQANVTDASLLMSLRYQQDDTVGESMLGDHSSQEDLEEFELVESDSENASSQYPQK